MDIQVILKILYFVLLLVLGGATLYYKTNDKLRSKVATLIAKAEYEYKDVVKAGGKKKASGRGNPVPAGSLPVQRQAPHVAFRRAETEGGHRIRHCVKAVYSLF